MRKKERETERERARKKEKVALECDPSSPPTHKDAATTAQHPESDLHGVEDVRGDLAVFLQACKAVEDETDV